MFAIDFMPPGNLQAIVIVVLNDVDKDNYHNPDAPRHLEDRVETKVTPMGPKESANVPTTEEVRVTTPPEISGMGHRMKRKEDPRFIQGRGNYVDDIKLPGMLYMDIVRSPYAHAKIVEIDASEALATEGVLAVITGKDMAAHNLAWMPTLMSDTQMVLPIDKVVYYAQEVCAVIATSRYIAADAVEKVYVEYEPLDPVVDPFDALEDNTIVRDDKEEKTNRIWHWEVGDKAATDEVFANAKTVIKEHMYIPRIHVSSIETCGMVANYNTATGNQYAGYFPEQLVLKFREIERMMQKHQVYRFAGKRNGFTPGHYSGLLNDTFPDN